ncbi:hypothetical protein [Bradyrhizobium sp. 956_D2_N1_5]|jgi:hypothetical protein|uniref:hypothetical protein n=1 Tax=unclassified Bradyrhizobium TaxID=2631580 RepID=UPI003F22199F
MSAAGLAITRDRVCERIYASLPSMVARRIVLSMVSDDRSCIRSAKLKIIPPNGKDRDFVVDGLGSRAVINSLLACFDAAQGLKGKKKGRG